MTLPSLIAQLESAKEGSAELDRAITELVRGHSVGERGTYTPYSRSVDAAISLLPEGWRICEMTQNDRLGTWEAMAVSELRVACGYHRELPIAICAAALKALATLSTPEQAA